MNLTIFVEETYLVIEVTKITIGGDHLTFHCQCEVW